MVVSMADCMVRNLQRFVEEHLPFDISWGEVTVLIPKDGDGNVAEATFDIRGANYLVRVESGEANRAHPCGSILVNGDRVGPIDALVWQRVADWIKADDPQAAA